MSASPATHRRHFSISLVELGKRLGVPGSIFRVWGEDTVDYLHMLTFDPDTEHPTLLGGYADDEGTPQNLEHVYETPFADQAMCKAWLEPDSRISIVLRGVDPESPRTRLVCSRSEYQALRLAVDNLLDHPDNTVAIGSDA